MISYDFGMHQAGVFLHLLLLACRAGGRRAGRRRVLVLGDWVMMRCCAITVWVIDSTSALAIMAEMCFRISSGCRAGASPARRRRHGNRQRLPYKQYAIATALGDERRSVSEKALLQDQFSERKCAGWSGVE